MKRIVSALLVAGCLSVGAPSAFAAARAPAPAPAPNAGVVCTIGTTSLSVAYFLKAGYSPRLAATVMNIVIAWVKRNPGFGVTCVTPVTTPPPIIS